MKSEIGVIGLGVMGASLSRNLGRNGFSISIFNRHVGGKEENVASDSTLKYPELKNALAFDDLKAFALSLEKPRKIILMVNAGNAVDELCGQLSEILEAGDIIIDGGNSHFEDTDRRIQSLNTSGIKFLGAGISGGEKGALWGPSIMPSGKQETYKQVEQYLTTIAAKDQEGNSCCTYIGGGGSGHFVKMIHNGIEYAEMQLLAECYAVLKRQKKTNEEIAELFESWIGKHGSYLLGITVNILRVKKGNTYILDEILDKAGNKGTGKWAAISIADYGIPATLIPAALFARYLSFFKEIRENISGIFPSANSEPEISAQQLQEAYHFARIINHHQGFSLIRHASDVHGWNINLSEVARIWTEGCIIKSDFMKELADLLKTGKSILLHEKIIPVISSTHGAAKKLAMECMKHEIHAPCFIEAVNFLNGIKTANSSANLIQAQRDYFGAHGYQIRNDHMGETFHTDWEG